MNDNKNQELEKRVNDINKLQFEYSKIISEKVNLFRKYLEKFMPVFKTMKKYRFSFVYHKKIGFEEKGVSSSLGPIIGHNDGESVIYVYDIDENNIKKINVINKNKEDIERLDFFKENNFEDAIEGLIYNSKALDIIYDGYKKEIDKTKEILDKYKNLI